MPDLTTTHWLAISVAIIFAVMYFYTLKTNNDLSNLEWVTSSENNIHAINTGLRGYNKGIDNCRTKLTESKVLAIRRLYKIKPKTSKIKLSKKLNVTIGAIYGILKETSWKHLK